MFVEKQTARDFDLDMPPLRGSVGVVDSCYRHAAPPGLDRAKLPQIRFNQYKITNYDLAEYIKTPIMGFTIQPGQTASGGHCVLWDFGN